MKIYEAKSVINFFGGLLSSKEILASYDSLVEGSIFKSVIQKNTVLISYLRLLK